MCAQKSIVVCGDLANIRSNSGGLGQTASRAGSRRRARIMRACMASTRYLDRMQAAGKRMADMIDALLKLSHITRVELQVGPVDLSALAVEVAEQLRETEPHRVVEFAIAPGAIANADEELMRLVLDNLISNAWKFTSKHARAKIEVGVAQNGGGTTYFVRDDGAGFDMTYAHKLFGAFQRL